MQIGAGCKIPYTGQGFVASNVGATQVTTDIKLFLLILKYYLVI